jgi:hypothetical protein
MTLKMIRTDWKAIKSHHWRLLMMILFAAAFSLMGMSMLIIPLSALMAISFSMNTFAVEEKGKLDHLYLSLPVSRKNIVQGRYAFMLVCTAATLILCGIITIISSPSLSFATSAHQISIGIDSEIIVLMCCLSLAVGGVINLSMYPTMFRLGYEKGKIFGFYIPVIIFGAFLGLFNILVNHSFELFSGWLMYCFENPLKVSGISFVIGMALFYLSYRLSLWLYNKRNL